jgi:hypothetical protein
MEKRRRAGDVEALIREIQRYRAYLEAIRKAKPPPNRRDEGRSTK